MAIAATNSQNRTTSEVLMNAQRVVVMGLGKPAVGR